MMARHRAALKSIAERLQKVIPASAERTLAIRALHKASMLVNSAIVLWTEEEGASGGK
jgi:hypothetical protein